MSCLWIDAVCVYDGRIVDLRGVQDLFLRAVYMSTVEWMWL